MEDQERPRKQALYFRPLHSFTNPPTHRGGVARPLDPTAMACSQFHSVNEARITVGVPNPKENAIDQRIVVAVSQGRGDIGNMFVAIAPTLTAQAAKRPLPSNWVYSRQDFGTPMRRIKFENGWCS